MHVKSNMVYTSARTWYTGYTLAMERKKRRIMPFEALLGNERLKENLIKSLQKGRTSHFYVISGPKGSGKHTLAKLLAAALMCRESQRPCLACGPCRKILEDRHPDFIVADDPEKKTVPVALIRQIRDDMYIRPNEGEKKVYLFPRAQDMGVPGQNALLKVLEEPPAYGVFLLLTDNPEKLLPTVRSRCVELPLQPLPQSLLRRQLEQDFPQAEPSAIEAAVARSGGFLGQARELLSGEEIVCKQTEQVMGAICAKDPLLLVQTLAPMEKWKRDALIPVLQQWTEIVEGALACRAGMPALSPLASQLAAARSGQELTRLVNHLQKANEYALANVSPAAICGFLVWALR